LSRDVLLKRSTPTVLCDIYSLGVIFCELCHSLGGTWMERNEMACNIRKGIFPSKLKKPGWKKQRQTMKKMTQEQASQRPSANHMVQSALFLTQEQEIEKLRKRVKVLLEMNNNLRRQLKKESAHRNKIRLSANGNA